MEPEGHVYLLRNPKKRSDFVSWPVGPGRFSQSGARSGGLRRLVGLAPHAEQFEHPDPEEVGHDAEGDWAIGPVPVPDTVVEPENSPAEQPRVAFGDHATLHRPIQEGCPRQFEGARARTFELAGVLVAA